MIVNMLNHSNTQKKYSPNFCQITTTSYLKKIYVYIDLLIEAYIPGLTYDLNVDLNLYSTKHRNKLYV